MTKSVEKTMPNPLPTVGRKLSLIGLRGAGKSSVGRLLAERLGVLFLDLDLELTKHHGQSGESTGAFLERVGLPAFREYESSSLRQCMARPESLILATGGGAVLDSDNRDLLRSTSYCVWLAADPELLSERIAKDSQSRPALTDLAPLEEMRKLSRDREAFYASTAHLRLETAGHGIDAVVQQVLEQFPA